MKTSHFSPCIAAILSISALTVSAQNITQWSPSAPNSNWNDPSNWISGTPSTGDDISFGQSSRTEIDFSGSSSYNGIAFSDSANRYTINLRNGSDMTITGSGINDPYRAGVEIAWRQELTVRDGSSLTLTGDNNKLSNLHINNLSGYVTFKDKASAGNIYLANNGRTTGAAVTEILFTDNSTADTATIFNYGSAASVIFDKNANAGSSNITNAGNLSRVVFTDNARAEKSRIVSNGTDSYLIFNGHSVIGNATTGSSTTIFVSGTDAIGWFGENASSENLVLSNNYGARPQLIFTDNFSATGKVDILSDGSKSRLTIVGNTTMNGAINIRANGNAAELYIGERAKITGNGSIYSYGAGTFGPNIGFITDNASITRGAADLTIAALGNYSQMYIEGHATITNAIIAAWGGDANQHSSVVHIGGNATINTNKNITSNGINTVINIGGDSKITSTAAAGVISAISASTTRHGASVNIGDNASITGLNNGTNIVVSGGINTTVTIGGNSSIRNGRLDISGNYATASIRIQDNATFDNVRLVLRDAAATYTIAMDNKALTVDALTIVGTGGNIHFTGSADQELIIQKAATNSNNNVSFNDDGIIRGSLTTLAGTLILNKANSLHGNITALNGSTITLDHADAASTATLNLSTSGTINLGASLSSATNITFGGITGNGTLNASITDYYIGNNSYDSTFNGTLTGSGNITKIGDGALTLENITGSGYTGRVAIQNGTLGLNGTDLSHLSTPLIVNAGAALRIGAGQSLIKDLSIQSGGILDVHVSKNNGTISSGNLFVSNLGGASLLEDIVYRATQNMSLSDERLSSGDIIEGFLTTNDSSVVSEGSKLYGKVRSTNTMSFILNSTVSGSNATLDLEVLTNSLADYAGNSNQASIAGALDHIIQNHPGDDLAIAADNASDPRQVIDSINPAGLSSMARLVYMQTSSEIDVISSRMDMQRHLGSALRQNSQVNDAVLRVSSSIQSFQLPASMLSVSTKPIPTPGAKSSEETLPYQQSFWSGYIAGTASFGSIDADKNSAGYDYRQSGLALGLDKSLGSNEGIAGFQLSYHNGKSDLDKPSEGEVKLNSFRLAGYAGWLTRSGLSMQTHLALSYHDYETERRSFDNGNVLGSAKGDTNGYGAAISAELAKIFTVGKQLQWKHGPHARLTYDWLSIKGYDEQGTITALHIGKQTPDSFRSTLGWKLWHENTNASGSTFLFNARIGWAHEYNNPNQSISARFAHYDAGFTVRGPNTRKDSLACGISAQILFRSGRFIGLHYQGDINDDQSTHFINARIGGRF